MITVWPQYMKTNSDLLVAICELIAKNWRESFSIVFADRTDEMGEDGGLEMVAVGFQYILHVFG